MGHSDDVLASETVAGFTVESIPSDAIEHFMPLTRPGLPEHLQGLIWMDQWGVAGESNLGSRELLKTVGPDFMTEKETRARPDLLMSFAGSPFETIDGNHVSSVAVNPTAVGNWSWFGIVRSAFLDSSKADDPPFVYKFIFDPDWKKAVIVPATSSGWPENLRFTMTYGGENTWHRRTYDNPEMTGKTYHYTAHRIVDGAGNRLPFYDDYLTIANMSEVSGTEYPDSVVLTRIPGATDNSAVLAKLPKTGAWPAWSEGKITFPPD